MNCRWRPNGHGFPPWPPCSGNALADSCDGEGTVNPIFNPKRRRSVRYIVSGQVIFYTGSPDSCGDLVNVGRHGMLVRTNVRVPVGTQFRIGFAVDGYPTPFQGDSRVVGMDSNLVAMKFVEEATELALLLQWLDQENIPWTGLDEPDGDRANRMTLPGTADLASSRINRPNPELEAILPFVEAMG